MIKWKKLLPKKNKNKCRIVFVTTRSSISSNKCVHRMIFYLVYIGSARFLGRFSRSTEHKNITQASTACQFDNFMFFFLFKSPRSRRRRRRWCIILTFFQFLVCIGYGNWKWAIFFFFGHELLIANDGVSIKKYVVRRRKEEKIDKLVFALLTRVLNEKALRNDYKL